MPSGQSYEANKKGRPKGLSLKNWYAIIKKSAYADSGLEIGPYAFMDVSGSVKMSKNGSLKMQGEKQKNPAPGTGQNRILFALLFHLFFHPVASSLNNQCISMMEESIKDSWC